MSYTPIQHDIGLVAYSVREFRNGIFIGEAMRECVVYCINSSDSFPLLSGIDQTASYNDTFCVGRNSCFSILAQMLIHRIQSASPGTMAFRMELLAVLQL
ncbi:MAG: hypothetical protein IPQ03_12890 [Bacteroidetes bacterium]|nr:hypothetical protein [Bacteroidota bacterium]